MSLLAVLAGAASAVFGLFGMNLTSGLETDVYWFNLVVVSTCGGVALVGAVLGVVLFVWLLPGEGVSGEDLEAAQATGEEEDGGGEKEGQSPFGT